ncbi:AT hook-like protein [Kipferlia bialata]|uniref:AT hook-like protein n=1 Tax=Kipferlia bialata TaxID=797122 RepID=A0A9K3CV22_9EUKA|nr:AT hook-like protein [Kipferlia bialata]|eukprot:g3214.t1
MAPGSPPANGLSMLTSGAGRRRSSKRVKQGPKAKGAAKARAKAAGAGVSSSGVGSPVKRGRGRPRKSAASPPKPSGQTPVSAEGEADAPSAQAPRRQRAQPKGHLDSAMYLGDPDTLDYPVSTVAKNALLSAPGHMLSKEIKTALQRSSSTFVAYLTHRCLDYMGKRKTVSIADMMKAAEGMEIPGLVDFMTEQAEAIEEEARVKRDADLALKEARDLEGDWDEGETGPRRGRGRPRKGAQADPSAEGASLEGVDEDLSDGSWMDVDEGDI